MFDRKLTNVLLGFICILAIGTNLIGAGFAQPSPNTQSNFRADFPFNKIEAMTYKNETIRIDGNEYIHCTFDNVIFQFDGEAPYQFTNDQFAPGSKVAITSTNPAIKAVIGLVDKISKLQNPAQNRPNETK